MARTLAPAMLSLAVLIGAPAGPPGASHAPASAQELDLDRWELVDLTHPFDGETVYWPTAPSEFRLDTLAYGQTEAGFFYAAAALCTPEHGGTHLDAPLHFHERGLDAASIPLDRLVGPAVVIDVRERAAADPDYRLTVEDVRGFEAEHGRIAAGTIVLLRTGWSERWPDRAAYLGDDTRGDASNLRFPSYGPEAARLLVEGRGVAALGADVASIDPGRSTRFPVHRLAAAADVPGFENLANLERLPARGAVVIALPMKIAGGTGGPLRAVALVPRSGPPEP